MGIAGREWCFIVVEFNCSKADESLNEPYGPAFANGEM
jgi:hypothetical protein